MKQSNSDILWAMGYHSEDEIQHPQTESIFEYMMRRKRKIVGDDQR